MGQSNKSEETLIDDGGKTEVIDAFPAATKGRETPRHYRIENKSSWTVAGTGNVHVELRLNYGRIRLQMGRVATGHSARLRSTTRSRSSGDTRVPSTC